VPKNTIQNTLKFQKLQSWMQNALWNMSCLFSIK
jgi:hypothetical protein